MNVVSQINREDAEEYTQGLGRIGAGLYRQIALAQKIGVPQALDLSLPDWVQQHLGGYMKMSMPERREAVAELKDEGHSNREIGQILGVDEITVRRDATNVAPATENDSDSKDADDGDATNVAPGPHTRPKILPPEDTKAPASRDAANAAPATKNDSDFNGADDEPAANAAPAEILPPEAEELSPS